jgi:hypothetical protein
MGGYYSPPELDAITDRGQMALYTDYQPKYAISQRIKDALSPFRTKYDFDFPDSLDGIVTVPSDRNYLNLLDLYIRFAISGIPIVKRVSVEMVNEDVFSNRMDSQVNPVSATAPIGEVIALGSFQLEPQVQYRGTVTFLRRPVAPVFGYSVISGRVIVYDPTTSTQLEWNETELNAIALKTLEMEGINLSAQDVSQFAEAKTQANWLGQNRL